MTGRKVAEYVIALVVVAMTVTIAVLNIRLVNAQRARTDAATQRATVRVVQAQAKVETVTVRLKAASADVRRAIPRVKVETLTVAPKTPADTQRAVAQLGALATEHASLQHKCSALVISCDEYRAASEHRDTAYRALIDTLRLTLKATQPGRLRSAWEHVDQYVTFGVGLYAGSRLSCPR